MNMPIERGLLGELAVLDRTGDTKTIWDPSKEVEVAIARDAFNALKKKGYLIYRVDGDGGQGTTMHEFDPKAGKYIAVPAVVGG